MSEIEKKAPQVEMIIDFMNSLLDRDLKGIRIVDRIEGVTNVTTILEKRELLRSLKKKIDEAQLAIYKFKRQFRKMKKFGFPSPWEMDPWLQ
jgi:hypothetical protein